MTLTAWLLVFGGLTVTAIVIDGLRRMFASHAALKIDIDESLCGLHQEEFTSELPNGGARAVGPGVIVLASSDGSDSDIEPYAELEPMALELSDITLDEVSVEPFLEIEVEEASVEPSLEIEVEATASLVEADTAVLAVEDRHEELQEQFQQQLHEDDAELFLHDESDYQDALVSGGIDTHPNEENFILESVPVNESIEANTVLTETADAGEIDSDVVADARGPSLNFDPTRPVHEWVETNSMVQSDLFAEQDLTELATVKSHVPHELLESSDDILFSDTGIEDIAASGAEHLAKISQDESLSTKLAKVTSMTFGKKLLSRKRVAAQSALDLALVEERSNNVPAVEQVISILVTANDTQGFYGSQLLKLVEACGLVHGEMDIFHRFEDGLRLGKTQFSMANMMEPGTFNLKEMEHLHSPGVVFFLGLPTAQDSMQAFDYMLETAQCLATNLGGEVLDEQRSVMRPQTIEHCRQQIREFERRNMTRRAQL
jgi:cell division protein ZipA